MGMREHILEAVLDVTDEVGLYNVTIAKVAEKAECSEDAVTKYFADLETLLNECYRNVFSGYLNTISLPEHEWTRYSIEENMKVVWFTIVHYAIANPKFISFFREFRDARHMDFILEIENFDSTPVSDDYAEFYMEIFERLTANGFTAADYEIYLVDCVGVFLGLNRAMGVEITEEYIFNLWKVFEPGLLAMIRKPDE